MSNIRNPYEYSLGYETEIIYWESKKKVTKFVFPISAAFTDGGIMSTKVEIIPLNSAGTSTIRSMDLSSWINHKITFTNCHEILHNGAISLEIPYTAVTNVATYADVETNC